VAKAMRPFRDSQARYWLSGPRTDVPAEPPSHRPWWYVIRTSKELRNWDLDKRNNSGHLCHRYSRHLTKLWCRQLYH